MSEENFERFREMVLRDLSMQERLREITDRAEFISRVVEMSAECGYEIAPHDIEEAMRRNRRAWLEEWI